MDKMHKLTDELLNALEEKLAKDYGKLSYKFKKELELLFRKTKHLPLDATWQERLMEFNKSKKLDLFIAFTVISLLDQNKESIKEIESLSKDIYSENRNWMLYHISVISLILFKKKNSTDLGNEFKKDLSPFFDIAKDNLKDKINIKSKLEREVKKGIMKGESIDEIAQRIQSIVKANYNSAVRIARTEVTKQENLARLKSMEETKKAGLNIKKQWLATIDKRTRDRHRITNGQIRDLDKRFSNGCLYPGDPSANTDEVINCRCTMTTEFVDFDKHELENKIDKSLKDKSYKMWGGL